MTNNNYVPLSFEFNLSEPFHIETQSLNNSAKNKVTIEAKKKMRVKNFQNLIIGSYFSLIILFILKSRWI